MALTSKSTPGLVQTPLRLISPSKQIPSPTLIFTDRLVGERIWLLDNKVVRVSSVLHDLDRLEPTRDSGKITHLVVRRDDWLLRLFDRTERIVSVDLLRFEPMRGLTLTVESAVFATLPEFLSDSELSQSVEKAIGKVEVVRRVSLPWIQISAHDGVVTLEGNVINRAQARFAVKAARTVKAARRIEDRLVADDDLEIAVAAALADDPRTRSDYVRVSARLGTVSLVG